MNTQKILKVKKELEIILAKAVQEAQKSGQDINLQEFRTKLANIRKKILTKFNISEQEYNNVEQLIEQDNSINVKKEVFSIMRDIANEKQVVRGSIEILKQRKELQQIKNKLMNLNWEDIKNRPSIPEQFKQENIKALKYSQLLHTSQDHLNLVTSIEDLYSRQEGISKVLQTIDQKIQSIVIPINHSNLQGINPNNHHQEKHTLESHLSSDMMDNLKRLLSGGYIQEFSNYLVKYLPQYLPQVIDVGGITRGDADSYYLRLDGTTTPTANIRWGTYKITELGDPTEDQDAATKVYVDSQISGENHWDKVAGVLTPHTAGDDLDMGIGKVFASNLLYLDQTTPQTIINGIPLLSPTRIINANQQLVDKQYVDLAVSSLVLTEYFTNDDLIPDVGDYKKMCTDLPAVLDTITSATFNYSASPTAIFSFLTSAGEPALDRLVAGTYTSHVHIYRATGNKEVKVYYELWRTDALGVDISKLGTSATSDFFSDGSAEIINLQLVLTDEVTITTTDRIAIKWFAYTEVGGTNISVSLEIGGTQDSNFGININPLELKTIFVPYTGAIANVDLGTKTLTTPTIYGSAASGGNLQLYSTSHATKGLINLGTTLTVDSVNGLVGIGTAAPGRLLQINGDSATEVIAQRLYNTNIATGASVSLEFAVYDTAASTLAKIQAIRMGPNAGLDLAFLVSESTGTTLTERMRITESGNVGIGTTSPLAKLHLLSAHSITVNDLMFSFSSSGNYRNGIANFFADADAPNNKMTFRVSDGTVSGQISAMTLQGNGNVGIGTTAPGAKLTVAGGSQFTGTSAIPTGAGLEIAYTGGISYVNSYDRDASAYKSLQLNTLDYRFLVSGAEKVRIDTAGNVGIGTDTPTALLHLKAGTATANTAPLKFTSGTLLTTPEAGVIEFLTDALYFTTTTGPTRQQISTASNSITLTNKRITKRTGSTTSSATPTINTDNVDMYLITAQAEAITSFTTNLSGTPTEGQTLWIAITGTAARAITWGTSFEASTIALPTTTVSTNRLDVGFIWNSVTNKWRVVAVT